MYNTHILKILKDFILGCKGYQHFKPIFVFNQKCSTETTLPEGT